MLLGPACEGNVSGGEDNPPVDGGEMDSSLNSDRDGDGLCDASELQYGTDPDDPDTDDDKLPDLIEVILGLDALSNLSPDPSALLLLQATQDTRQEFELRVTIDGQGGDYSGLFLDSASIWANGETAATYLVSSSALAAAPPDNVRDIDSTAQTFLGVNGETRLRFGLEFLFADADDLPCTLTLPFQYVVVDNSGAFSNTDPYLLVLTPSGALESSDDFCTTSSCF